MGQFPIERLLEEVAEQASREVNAAVHPRLLSGYVSALVDVAGGGRRIGKRALQRCQSAGTQAARDGVPLPVVVDAYMSATRLAWTRLPELADAAGRRRPTAAVLLTVGQAMLRTTDDALAAVADGYAEANRLLIRQEESLRREFVDDLLGGHGELGELVARAERFGLPVAAPHLVSVVAASKPFSDTEVAVTWVEALLRARLGQRGCLVATKDGRLVCIVSSAYTGRVERGDRALLTEMAGRAASDLTGRRGGWRLGIGNSHPGATGIATSYREANDVLDLAARLDWPERVVPTDRLAVYRVLLRDSDAITSLVGAVLSPLAEARNPGALLETLTTYFDTGAVATETARRLHLSIRAVTYRLKRIGELTGYDPADPASWLSLHVAAVGAQLLGWPDARR